MKQLQVSFIAILFSASALASASASALATPSDLSSLKTCVEQGYNGLTNRRAIVAAVVAADGTSQVMTFGTAQQDQIFEIGSISKTFTANLLAQSVTSGTLKLSDPIPSAYQKPGATISYQNLTTHTSGIIAGLFPTFKVTNDLVPFEGLTIPIFKQQYALTPLASAPGTKWAYSNLGVSLLGLILAENQHAVYESLVQTKVFQPLAMNDSYFAVPASQAARFPTGQMIMLNGAAQEMPHWDLFNTAIDPAGGIRSTIGDMIKYTLANLSPSNSTLAAPIQLSQQKLYFIQDYNMWIAMNWIVQPDQGLIWHNGETYGFNSILAMSTTRAQAVVAMTDTTVQTSSGFDTSLQDVAFRCLK